MLTASHNPGGPNADFGIKLNCSNGGPAPDNVTERIFAFTKSLKSYNIITGIHVDIGKIQSHHVQIDSQTCVIDVIDSVDDYVTLMKEIFDFPTIKKLLCGESGSNQFRILVDCLNGGKCFSIISFNFSFFININIGYFILSLISNYFNDDS